MGKFSDKINGMIQRVLESAEFTSASPGFINTLIQINAIENPDFEQDIKDLIKEESKQVIEKPNDEAVKQKRQVSNIKDKIDLWDKGNVGNIHNFTAEQFGNVRQLATNPTGFMLNTFMRKFAKGAGVVALALLIFEAVKWIIGELMKPGRMLDIRFRRTVEKEILAFRSREEKQRLQQGFSNVIVTSIGGLRGGEGMTFNTYRTVASGQSLFPKNFIPPQMVAEGLPLSKSHGKRTRFGR